jgi:hypothetical protein
VALKAQKTMKAQLATSDREMVFGDIIRPIERKLLSPRVTIAQDRGLTRGEGVKIEDSGMGVKDEGMGMIVGGKGLIQVGEQLDAE